MGLPPHYLFLHDHAGAREGCILSNLGWNHHIALTPAQPTRELGIRNRYAQIDNLR